jgi:hypothetical protein
VSKRNKGRESSRVMKSNVLGLCCGGETRILAGLLSGSGTNAGMSAGAFTFPLQYTKKCEYGRGLLCTSARKDNVAYVMLPSRPRFLTMIRGKSSHNFVHEVSVE